MGGGMHAADRPSRGTGRAIARGSDQEAAEAAAEEGAARGVGADEAAKWLIAGSFLPDDREPAVQLRASGLVAAIHQQGDDGHEMHLLPRIMQRWRRRPLCRELLRTR